MSEVKVVGRGVDTLVLNVCNADETDKPVKQELASDVQDEARSQESVGSSAFKAFRNR